MDVGMNRYRNLANWPDEAWEKLDIHLFIVANFNRYCTSLVKKVGTRNLPSDAVDSLPGLFCDVAHKPLSAVHQRNLDARGERRNQVMLGTLKIIEASAAVYGADRERLLWRFGLGRRRWRVGTAQPSTPTAMSSPSTFTS